MSTLTITSPSTVKRFSFKVEANQFDQLVQVLKDELGPTSGLDSAEVDVNRLSDAMAKYQSSEAEWSRYALPDPSRGYTRNLVDDGNGKSNLLVLAWTPGKGSPIHDHGNAHCVMKILQGSLTETRYDFPDPDVKEPTPMNVKKRSVYTENSVAYMADDLGVHRISNEGSDYAVSLHLYTPPNVARGGCFIFDEKTSRQSHVAKCGHYSAYGQILRS